MLLLKTCLNLRAKSKRQSHLHRCKWIKEINQSPPHLQSPTSNNLPPRLLTTDPTNLSRHTDLNNWNNNLGMTSSPAAAAVIFDPDITLSSDDGSFVYLNDCRFPYNRMGDSDSDEITIFDINQSAQRGQWEDRPLKVLKYVDDFLGAEKLRIKDGYLILTESKPQRMIRAWKSEQFFSIVSTRCRDVCMSVNASKTQMLTISASVGEDVKSYIKTTDGGKITSQDTLRILGFVFGTRPTVAAHVEHLCNTFRRRLWILRHLKNANINTTDLTRLYQVLVLPTLDYASTVYHSQLTQEQSDAFEKLQAHALKIIHGFKPLYEELLAMSGVGFGRSGLSTWKYQFSYDH